MKLLALACAFLTISAVHADPVRIAWFGLSRPWTLDLVQRYIVTPEVELPLTVGAHHSEATPNLENEVSTKSEAKAKSIASRFSFSVLPPEAKNSVLVDSIPIKTDGFPNPFHVTDNDFAVGRSLPWPLTNPTGAAPYVTSSDLKWFDWKATEPPNVFIIAGHHVISEGFHDDEESHFLFVPTLEQTLSTYPASKTYFSQVKLAILFGCNTLTNLEPHHEDGSVMDPSEIRNLYLSETSPKERVIGSSNELNSLEFYRHRLATEYGLGKEEYAYTRDPQAEHCDGPNAFENCAVANLDRILPDSGLYDGSHRYNEALKARNMFPNAYLVLGFSSASPSEETRVQILEEAVRIAGKMLKLKNENVIHQIISSTTSETDRRQAVVALRTAWETVTYEMNRYRPSGSITPAYPDIDAGYVMTLHRAKGKQLYAKYR